MNELHTTTSDFSVTQAINKMVETIEQESWHLFARINHAKEAEEKGLELRPTELILFGNPEIGTKLMQDQQISAIDLPMKALAWEEEEGQTKIACNSMDWLKERHNLTDEKTIADIDRVITKVCRAAVGDQ